MEVTTPSTTCSSACLDKTVLQGGGGRVQGGEQVWRRLHPPQPAPISCQQDRAFHSPGWMYAVSINLSGNGGY